MPKPKLVGILNVTPDSFSDGGKYHHYDAALAHAVQLVEDGASVIDVGAESTRPGATPLTAEEEWQRAGEILAQLCQHYHSTAIQISFDTRHAANAEKAIALGVNWINDVSGLDDEAMQHVVIDAPASSKVVVMHHLGIPASKTTILPENENPTHAVLGWAESKLLTLDKLGISKERVMIDPGLGFGKNAMQSLQLLRDVKSFSSLGVELLVGHSRKSFLQPFYGDAIERRDEGTLVASLFMAQQGVDYLRVHDVAMHHRAFELQTTLNQSG